MPDEFSLPEGALQVARACADAAGRAILPHFRRSPLVDDKSDESPVTIADRNAERAMRAVLAEHFPSHAILGEEFGATGPCESPWVWVIDPIDGTRAFISGRPTFTTLIALLHEGKPVLGIIDQPATGERWVGEAGWPTRFEPGLFWECGREADASLARTRTVATLSEAELSCTSPDMLVAPWDTRFAGLKASTRRTSWGGDAYAYGLLALGQIDLIAECTMKPWDWAALVPVVTGAGGSVTDWSGQPLTMECDGTVLACGNPAMLAGAVRALS